MFLFFSNFIWLLIRRTTACCSALNPAKAGSSETLAPSLRVYVATVRLFLVKYFLKNPFVNIDTINKIKLNYDDLVYFEGNGRFKISAAWLIEKCGWKGYKNDNIGVSSMHALVLVNYGEKSGEKLKELSKRVMEDVKNKFDIVGVITAPDKPAGRGMKLQQSAVKKYALEAGLKILQPVI